MDHCRRGHAVLTAMWTGAGISIKQSQDAALKNLQADAANLAFAFDEDVTHTLDSIAGTMEAVAKRMATRRSDMDLYGWRASFRSSLRPLSRQLSYHPADP
jgi:hypothetical protein